VRLLLPLVLSTGATLNEYVPAASPVTVQLVAASAEFILALEQPVPATAQSLVPILIATSYPFNLSLLSEGVIVSHDTTTSPALLPATAQV
jgi:hypothetical protein